MSSDSFRKKVDEVNAHLEEICARKDIAIIIHCNINPKWQEYKDSVSDNSPFVLGDSVSSNDISRMKKQRLDNASNTIIGHLNIN